MWCIHGVCTDLNVCTPTPTACMTCAALRVECCRLGAAVAGALPDQRMPLLPDRLGSAATQSAFGSTLHAAGARIPQLALLAKLGSVMEWEDWP